MQRAKPSSITLFLLMPFASITGVLFTPALPLVAKAFHVQEAGASIAMSIFLLGYALGTLLYGPLANRHGRKVAIYFGSVLMILGCFLSIFSGKTSSWNLFLFGRFISALGSSVGMMIAFTMIGDVFKEKEITKKIAMATFAFALAPSLATFCGGYLTVTFGWESCFYALIAYGLLIFSLGILSPETCLSIDKDALNPKKIFQSYRKKIKNKQLLYCAFILGCNTGILYLFSTFAPFLIISQLNISPETYGLLSCIPPLGQVVGTFTAKQLASSHSKLHVISLGIMGNIFTVLAMLFLFSFSEFSPWKLFIPFAVLNFTLFLVYSNASSLALEHAQDKSNGSAVMGFINVLFSAIYVYIAEKTLSITPLFLSITFLGITLMMLLMKKRLEKLAN